jgi:hypothetical protein
MNITNNRTRDLFVKSSVEILAIPRPPAIQQGQHTTRLEYAENGQSQKYNYDELSGILCAILRDGIGQYINGDAQRPFRWQISVLDLPWDEVANIVEAVQETAEPMGLAAQYDQFSRNNNTYLLDFEIVPLRGADSAANSEESKGVGSGSAKNKSTKP